MGMEYSSMAAQTESVEDELGQGTEVDQALEMGAQFAEAGLERESARSRLLSWE